MNACQHLDSMVLEIFARLNDSMNLQNPKQSPQEKKSAVKNEFHIPALMLYIGVQRFVKTCKLI